MDSKSAVASFVYFISDGAGSIKIGVTNDVPTRLAGLSTSTARELTLIGAVPGDSYQERQVHAHLAGFRRRGEWFEDLPPVRALIGKILSGGLVAAGFHPREVHQASPMQEQARRLAEIIERFGRQVVLDTKGEVFGVPCSVIWKAKYRPRARLFADELNSLRSGALRAVDAYVQEAQEARRWIEGLCDEDAVATLRGDAGMARIEELQAQLAALGAVQ